MVVPRTELFIKRIYGITKCFIRNKSQRKNLGKPPGVAKTLQQRFEELNFVDPKIHYKIDIGLPVKKTARKDVLSQHIEILKQNRSNSELEESSRENKLLVPLDEVQDVWAETVGHLHIKAAAEHYGIFEHLFGDAYFVPVVNLDIAYNFRSKSVPVYRGNCLKPEEVSTTPNVKFKSEEDSLWTLIMVTPDGHFTSDKSEYAHWFVGNIKGNCVKEGDVILDYLQPFPVKGAGYYRYVFVLYKQEGPINYSSLKKSPCLDLSERTFSTLEFYRERQSLLTPAGLAFFQADWDPSVNELFHNTLHMEAPEYCYDFPEHYHKKQEWFPIRQPFNLYLDRYRDEKQIAKEYIIKKLKATHPFRPPEPPLKFPNAIPFKKGTPSWLKLEKRKERLGWGRINDY